MLKKLLAATFAASLMAGSAWGADHVYKGTGWRDLADGADNPLPTTEPLLIGAGQTYISNSNAGTDPATGALKNVKLDNATGGLTLGESSGNFGGGSTKATGPVKIVADSMEWTADGATLDIKAGSELEVTNGFTMIANAGNAITNAGTLTLKGAFVGDPASKINNTAGTVTLASTGTGQEALLVALVGGGGGNVGTVNLNGQYTAGLNAAGTTAITAGTVNIGNQTASVTGAVNVGGATLGLNGGTYNGAITAAAVNFDSGRTVIGDDLTSVTGGVAIKDGATFVANNNIYLNGAKTVANAGTIEIANAKTLTIGAGYSSTKGAIVNNKGGTLDISTGANIAAAYTNTIFADLVSGGGGDVGKVKLSDALVDDWATAGVTAGDVTLAAQQTGAGVAVNVGGANLTIDGVGANTFKAVTAKTVTVGATSTATFTGAMTATALTANGNTTFDGTAASYTGSVVIANGKSVVADNGATITVNGELTFGDVASTLQNLGSTLTISDKVDTSKGFAPAAGSIVINGSASVTNLNGSSASLLMAVANAANDLGTINVNGDAGNQAFDLSAATAGKIVFTGDQKANTNAVTFGPNVDATFLGGESSYGMGFTAKSITIGDAAGSKAASTAFGGTVNGLVTVNTKSTFGTTGDAGATLTNGIDVKSGGIIAIGAQTTDDTKASTLETAGAATVAVSDEAKLKVASTVTSGDVFGTDFSGKLETAMGGAAALNEWLADQQMVTVANTGNFTYDGTKVSYNGTKNTTLASQRAALKGIMGDFGSVDFYPLVNNNLVTGIVDALNYDPADYANLGVRGQGLVDLLAALGGDTTKVDLTGRGRESYAGYRFASGQDLANSLEAVGDTVRGFNKAMTSRGMAVTGVNGSFGSSEAYGAPLTMCESYANRIWAGYAGQWGDANARGGDRGYEYSANGFNVGFDHTFGGALTVGTAFGYMKGDYTLKGGLGSDSDINNYMFGLYGTWNHESGLFANLAGTYTYSDYDMSSEYRASTWDRADYHGNTWSVGGDLGFAIRPVQNFSIIPSVGLYYYTSSTNTFSTTAGRADMKYKRHDLELPAQLTMKYDVCLNAESTLSLNVNGGYTYNFRDKGTRIDEFAMANTGIVMGGGHGRDPGHSGWNAGGGAQVRVRNFDVGVHYEYYARKEFDSHKVYANVGLSF